MPTLAETRGARPAFAWLLTACGGTGLLAAAVLLVEKIALLRDPAYVPSCSINPVLSCGSIMTTPQAEAFGFPNPLLGVAGFSVVTTVGMALLAGARPARWFWLGLQLGTTAGLVFVHWLIAQSLYRIGALCPYCMVVWVVTITLFAAVTSHNLRAHLIPAPDAVTRLTSYAPTVVAAWLLAIAALIVVRFWDYWAMLLRSGLPPLAWLPWVARYTSRSSQPWSPTDAPRVVSPVGADASPRWIAYAGPRLPRRGAPLRPGPGATVVQRLLYGQRMLTGPTRVEVMARLGRAMTDPTRAQILLALLDGPRYPAALARELDLTRSNVSNHLACLRGCGIVVALPEGRQTRYEIADPHLTRALEEVLRVVLAVDDGQPCADPDCDIPLCCGQDDRIATGDVTAGATTSRRQVR